MSGNGRDEFMPTADQVVLDNSTIDCIEDAENVQEGFEEICQVTALSASPGYSWGRSGTHSNGTWLRNNHVDSNKVGLPFGLLNGAIEKITVANQNATAEFDIRVYHHTGNLANLTLITTVTTTGSGTIEDFIVSAAIPQGKMLAVQINNVQQNGSSKPKETQVFLVVKGSLA